MSSSLISTIKQAILTETPSDVSIHERSLLSLLLEYDKRGEPITWKDFTIHSYKGKSLVIARHMIHCIQCLVLLVICGIYALYNVIYRLVTGKWRGMRPSSGINMVIFSAALIFSIVAFCFVLSFLIKDVVLAPNNAHINEQGVVTIDQPYLESQSFFLLNAATFWTSTGIPVSKGDVVYITASGSVYGDIGEMCAKANDNDTLLYSRNYFNPNAKYKRNIHDAQYCIYGRGKNDTDAYFGSLLYQICKDSQGPILHNGEIDAVKQIDFSQQKRLFQDSTFHFTAEESGILYLSFNDIYLDDPTLAQINTDKESKIPKDLEEHPIADIEKNPKLSEIWFHDNIGEVLVNIRVEKNICKCKVRWPMINKPLLFFYRGISKVKTPWPWKKQFWESKFALFFSIMALVFAMDIMVSTILKRRNNRKTINKMKLTKEEFKVLVMLYVASIDGNIPEDEVEAMLERTTPDIFKRMKKQFSKMSDAEILDCVADGKQSFATTGDAKAEILESIRAVIKADERLATIEEHLYRTICRLMK